MTNLHHLTVQSETKPCSVFVMMSSRKPPTTLICPDCLCCFRCRCYLVKNCRWRHSNLSQSSNQYPLSVRGHFLPYPFTRYLGERKSCFSLFFFCKRIDINKHSNKHTREKTLVSVPIRWELKVMETLAATSFFCAQTTISSLP